MVRKVITYIKYPVLIVGIVLCLVGVAYAATNIDSTNKWAWGTNVGWINFADTNGGVTVYSDHLEGYAWAENIGWIRLGTYTGGGSHTYANDAANTYGVNNDGVGNLSGYAWGTNVGWINFNPSDSQVTIDPVSGDFDGYAWAENVGWIHFKNTTGNAYKVNTTWHGDLTGTYQNDVAAIIKDGSTSSSSVGLTIADSSFLNDSGDGIIFGHDNGSGTTPTDCPSGVSYRWQRVWEFDVNDGSGTTGGNVNLTFDFSDAGFGTTPSGDYTLLKRSGESGDFTGIATTSNISGDQVIFNNVDSSLLGSYFTLGSGTPTAVTLSSFSAKSSAGHEASLVWPWLVGVAMLVIGGVFWMRRRLSTRGNFK